MEKFRKKTYSVFSDMLPERDFNHFFDLLGEEEKKAFGRAGLTFQKAIRCKACDSDICIALLCSAVEVLSCGRAVIFKDWLLKNKLSELADMQEEQVKTVLNRAYEDYLKNEKEREGISYNFRAFLSKYCPNDLKKPPIKIYEGKGEPFDVALRGLYSRFRSFFLHRGIGYASVVDEPFIDEETGEAVHMIAIPLVMKVDSKYVSFELTKITDWFAEVVKQSLLQYLQNRT